MQALMHQSFLQQLEQLTPAQAFSIKSDGALNLSTKLGRVGFSELAYVQWLQLIPTFIQNALS